MIKKAKSINLVTKVKTALQNGEYHYTGHAEIRLQQREVTRQEVKQVLASGHHEKNKDYFDEKYSEWNYAIKGKTLDKKSLRIIVSFDENNMLIITVIDLSR